MCSFCPSGGQGGDCALEGSLAPSFPDSPHMIPLQQVTNLSSFQHLLLRPGEAEALAEERKPRGFPTTRPWPTRETQEARCEPKAKSDHRPPWTSKLSVPANPQNCLHGHSNPWVGQCGTVSLSRWHTLGCPSGKARPSIDLVLPASASVVRVC